MIKYLKKSFFFIIPFIIYLVVIIIVDPYNYFNISHAISNDIKTEISDKVEPHLFRIINYQNSPKRNIVLGDSRADNLFEHFDAHDWANLSYGGGSIKEIVQTFWWVANEYPLDTVFIGINLNLYNKYNKRFWVEETLERKKNFASYGFNSYTLKSTFYIVKSLITGKEIILDKPSMTKEEFWEYQLNESAHKFYSKFSYPTNYAEELKTISDYCHSNHIQLIFWIPPTYIDFQKRKEDYQLEKIDSTFVNDLSNFGLLYNDDVDSELTRAKENFEDPMHFDGKTGELIFTRIFGKNP